MIKKAKRKFNTSGPNIPQKHYTLERELLVKKGLGLVEDERYFTIWAPRQTGKSTYLRMLQEKLLDLEYKVTHINLENYVDVPLSALFNYLLREIEEGWGVKFDSDNFGDFQNDIAKTKEGKCVLII
ncbi:MAG: hypothetical protein GY757_11625, partial [bacterium]|nr:hypothetical protein [bacterium]